jgi:hypothetical protein
MNSYLSHLNIGFAFISGEFDSSGGGREFERSVIVNLGGLVIL